MKNELKSGILSGDKSADGRPTVGGVNVIAVICEHQRRELITFFVCCLVTYKPRCEKTGLRGFRPGLTQVGLCNRGLKFRIQ